MNGIFYISYLLNSLCISAISILKLTMTSKRVEEMAMEEIKSNGGINSNTGSASSSRNHLESEKQPSSSSSNKGGSKDEEVPYYKLFSFIDSLDVMLMIVGTLGAIGNGVSFPVMTLLFGNIVNSFGDNPEDGEMLAAVVKVTIESFFHQHKIGFF